MASLNGFLSERASVHPANDWVSTRFRRPRRIHENHYKRAVDIVGAVVGLFLFLPLFAVVYLLVRMDGGPALFAHARLGRGGTSFKCYKFRSMVVDAEQRLAEHLAREAAARLEWDQHFKLVDDPRITPVGRILRKTSLDELPQLWNVLKGDMSLVGPRPIVIAEKPRYDRDIDFYDSCRPGITGLWQISGRADCDYGARVNLDVSYVNNWSLLLDLVIILRTVGVVVTRKGAY